ncbi:MAG: Lrp/AsnC family transcriptional regulator [Proteobacteria bacterium]|nr:Lrp/AsnC family transcriptional regulator [Pseudomonadota bacterium]
MAVDIDEFDRQILAALGENARLSNLELAERVPLSHSAISRRIKRLEEAKVIRAYKACIDPVLAGEEVRVFASVQRQPHVPAIEVAQALKDIPGIASCWIVSGDCDVMIEITARDMAHFSSIMLDKVQNAQGVASTRSMFILNALKER